MNKKMVKIPDVLFFQEGPGVRNNQYTSNGVKLLNVANLVDGKVDLSTSDRHISENEAYGKYKHFLCDDGDFIVASSGIKVEYIDKKMGFVDKSMLPLCMNTSTIRFKVLNKEQLNIRYFMYYLKSRSFKSQLFKQITGSAQLNYGPSHLKRMYIPLLSIDEQDYIVYFLDKIQTIIDLRKKQLVSLDKLIKARFVEMFEGNFPSVKLGDVIKTTSGGTPLKTHKEYYDNGTIPWLTSGEINAGVITKVKNFITEEGLNNSSAKIVPKNTVVIAMYGATAGVTGILRLETTTNQAVCSLLPSDRFIPEFLYYAVSAKKDWMISQCQGGGQPNISQGIIKSMNLIDAPKEEQIKFSDFAKQIDKSKVAVQKALDEAQLLFDSLMQEYFG